MAGSTLYSGTANPKHAIHRLNALQAYLNPVVIETRVKSAINSSPMLNTIATNVESNNLSAKVDSALSRNVEIRSIKNKVDNFQSLTKGELEAAVNASKEVIAIKALVDHEAIKKLLDDVLNANPKIQKIEQALATAGDCVITTESWLLLRKGFQLLNRLEDWVLAEEFQGLASTKLKQNPDQMPPEFKQDEFNSLLEQLIEALRPHGSDTKLVSVKGVFETLKRDFPKQNNNDQRAQYFGELAMARFQLPKAIA